MAEIYLDPMIIVLATIIVVSVIAIFDFMPYKKRTAEAKIDRVKE